MAVAPKLLLLAALAFVAQAQQEPSAKVTLYDLGNFNGNELPRHVTSCMNLPSNFERKLNSLRFQEGACLAVYDDCGCKGFKVSLNGDNGNLGSIGQTARSISPCGTYSKFPSTIVENWYALISNHDNSPIERSYRDDYVAIYLADVAPGTNWMFQFASNVWAYVLQNYGSFGSGEGGMLMAIFHAGAENGINQPLYGLECNSGYRHGVHVMTPATDGWQQEDATSTMPKNENDVHIVTHEIAHVVESNAYGVNRSPAFPLWRDSKWAEIFNYDVYLGLGMAELAERWRAQVINSRDDYPRPGTAWFRDWFLPIYEGYGEGKVLARFYETMANHFPKRPTLVAEEYVGDMNHGEFVHFWSGAAGKNLKSLAETAFGWTDEMEEQWQLARWTFDKIQYDD